MIPTDVSEKYEKKLLEQVVNACHLAYSQGLSVCTAKHLLVVLLENDTVLSYINQIGINVEGLRQAVQKSSGTVDYPFKIKKGIVHFSPGLKKTLLDAYGVSKWMDKDSVGVEEAFLAVLNDPDIKKIASEKGLDVSQSDLFAPKATENYPSETKQSALDEYFLKQISKNLSEKASRGELEEIVNRDSEFEQIARILISQKNNNVLLLGEVGVGKSSVVHRLAMETDKTTMGAQLKDYVVLEISISMLSSLLEYRNFQDVKQQIRDEIAKEGEVILYVKNYDFSVDEVRGVQTFIQSFLKFLLDLKNVRLIVSTNSSSYRNLLTKDPNFAERFGIVRVSEASVALTEEILAKKTEGLSKFHSITIGEDVIKACASLSKRYLQDKFLPSKAINLLDEASSKVALEGRNVLNVDDLKVIISEKTGIPVERLSASEQQKLLNLEQSLNKSIVGQKQAVYKVSEVVRRSRAGLKDPKKPVGTFLFLGPTGVGKTYLAKSLARVVYDSENALVRLDMSEFSEAHTVQRLIGSPPGYVGYEEGGQLTNPIWERPYSLILLDEIEKANPKVFDIFLQVLDEGRLTDGQGRTVDFKNTIIIATSNIASEVLLNRLSGSMSDEDRSVFFEQEVLPILRQYFLPEFINRFDDVILFNPLTFVDIVEITKIQIRKMQHKMQDKKITIQVSEEKINELAKKGFKPGFGARPIIRVIQEQVENVIARKIISGEINEGDTVNI